MHSSLLAQSQVVSPSHGFPKLVIMIVNEHGLVKTANDLCCLMVIFVCRGSTVGACWLHGLGCDAHHCYCYVSRIVGWPVILLFFY